LWGAVMHQYAADMQWKQTTNICNKDMQERPAMKMSNNEMQQRMQQRPHPPPPPV